MKCEASIDDPILYIYGELPPLEEERFEDHIEACAVCREEIDVPEHLIRAVGMKPSDFKGKTIYGPVGCEECSGSGYRGRAGCYELMEMTAPIREAISPA